MYIHISVCGVVHGDMIARPTPMCLYIHLMCECEVVTGHIHTHSCAVLPVLVSVCGVVTGHTYPSMVRWDRPHPPQYGKVGQVTLTPIW